ncbi:hypothetical protein, partial [Deinococcus saxicola]
MADPQPLSLIQFVPPLITAVSVGVALYGLRVNNILASHREARKERRAKIDAIVKSLDELEQMAIEFNQAESYDLNARERILRAVTRIKGRIDRLGFNFEEQLQELYADMR